MSDARPSTQLGSLLQSIKMAKAKESHRGSIMAGTASVNGSAAGDASPAATPRKEKHKKLSEKGKAKLAEHRAGDFLLSEQNRLEQAYAEAHPELIDENGEIDMPSVNDLFGDGLTADDRLAHQIVLERKAIENEEMVRKLAKLQRKHNTMQNAMTKGNKVAAGYDRDEVDLRVVQKELKKNREKAKTATIVLEEAIPLIRNATNAAAVGMKALLAYLSQESILREFSQTDIRYLRASLDAELERRNSPINFRVEILWRFACIIHEFKKGDREQNLRLAQHVYEKLLERCDPEVHPFQYAGLKNTLDLCQIEMERVTGYKIINRANRDLFSSSAPPPPPSPPSIPAPSHRHVVRFHAPPELMYLLDELTAQASALTIAPITSQDVPASSGSAPMSDLGAMDDSPDLPKLTGEQMLARTVQCQYGICAAQGELVKECSVCRLHFCASHMPQHMATHAVTFGSSSAAAAAPSTPPIPADLFQRSFSVPALWDKFVQVSGTLQTPFDVPSVDLREFLVPFPTGVAVAGVYAWGIRLKNKDAAEALLVDAPDAVAAPLANMVKMWQKPEESRFLYYFGMSESLANRNTAANAYHLDTVTFLKESADGDGLQFFMGVFAATPASRGYGLAMEQQLGHHLHLATFAGAWQDPRRRTVINKTILGTEFSKTNWSEFHRVAGHVTYQDALHHHLNALAEFVYQAMWVRGDFTWELLLAEIAKISPELVQKIQESDVAHSLATFYRDTLRPRINTAHPEVAASQLQPRSVKTYHKLQEMFLQGWNGRSSTVTRYVSSTHEMYNAVRSAAAERGVQQQLKEAKAVSSGAPIAQWSEVEEFVSSSEDEDAADAAAAEVECRVCDPKIIFATRSVRNKHMKVNLHVPYVCAVLNPGCAFTAATVKSAAKHVTHSDHKRPASLD